MKKRVLSLLIVMFAVLIPTQLWAQEPYAVLSEDSVGNMTLTFYYDDQRVFRNGFDIGPFASADDRGWASMAKNITTAVFDASFEDYKPTSTAYWFYECQNLTTISGIEKLNTDNVTDMSNMFNNCPCNR